MSDGAEVVVLRDLVSAVEVSAFADALGATLTEDTTRGWFVLATRAWMTPDDDQIVYIEDHTSDVRWIQTTGPARARIATKVREQLPHYDTEELLSAARGSEPPSDCIQILSRLVPYRPDDFDPRFFAVWERMLAHPLKAVRRAAIRTAYGCRWPEMRALAETRLDADRELAAQLEQLLSLFDEHG